MFLHRGESMDWITGISKAIDYIEEHITEPTDYARAAKEACSSPFNFQRMFALLCGYTLGDYVRMRRLTLAGEALLSTDAKVIDVALKYGYDSPESFSRAFTRFHGVSPSAVRKGAAIRSFSRICVKLILTGGSIMEYRIEKKQAAKIICRRREFTKPGDDYTNREIPEFLERVRTRREHSKALRVYQRQRTVQGTSRRVLLDRDDGQRLSLRHRCGV